MRLSLYNILGILGLLVSPCYAQEIATIESLLCTGRSSIKQQMENIYQNIYHLPVSTLNNRSLWLLSRNIDNAASPYNIYGALSKYQAFLDFWKNYYALPQPLNWEPRWSSLTNAIGESVAHKPGTLFDRAYQMETTPQTDTVTLAQHLGQPFDSHTPSFFSQWNTCLSYVVRDPLITLLGYRITDTQPFCAGVLGQVEQIRAQLHARMQSDSENATLLQKLSLTFGEVRPPHYLYPCTFNGLLYSIIADIDVMFPALPITTFTEIFQYINAAYDKAASALIDPAHDLTSTLNTWAAQFAQETLDPTLGDLVTAPNLHTPVPLLAPLITLRTILAQPTFDWIGDIEDPQYQETLYGMIALLENKIGDYESPALQQHFQQLRERLLFVKESLQQILNMPVTTVLSHVHQILSVDFPECLIAAFSDLTLAEDINVAANEAWSRKFIGTVYDLDYSNTLCGILNRALKEMFAMPVIKSFGELPELAVIDYQTRENFARSIHNLYQITHHSELAQHRDITNYLLVNTFGDIYFQEQSSILSLTDTLSSLFRSSSARWDIHLFQDLLKYISRSPAGDRSLSDLLYQIEQKFPSDPSDADGEYLKQILAVTNTIMPEESSTNPAQTMPYLNKILFQMNSIFIQHALGSPADPASTAADASIFQWVGALQNPALVQQTWGRALSDIEIAYLEKFKTSLEEVQSILAEANQYLLTAKFIDIYKFIGGITHAQPNSLRNMFHDLFMELYTPGSSRVESLLLDLHACTDKFYNSLCCSCTEVDKLISVYAMCMKDIVDTLTNAPKIHIDNALYRILCNTIQQAFKDIEDCFDDLQASLYLVPYNFCSADIFVPYLTTIAEHFLTLTDVIHSICFSVSPNLSLDHFPRGENCEHIATSIQNLITSSSELYQTCIHIYMSDVAFVGDAQELVDIVYNGLVSTAFNCRALSYTLKNAPQLILTLCATCTCQPTLTDSLQQINNKFLEYSKAIDVFKTRFTTQPL